MGRIVGRAEAARKAAAPDVSLTASTSMEDA
jgi:hypothetical protein